VSAYFHAPEWLVLLPFLAFAAWRWRGLGAWHGLRLACLGLLVLAAAEPQWPRGGRGTDLWVLVDGSASARDLIEPRRAEIEALLARSRGADDKLHFVDYASSPLLRGAAPEAFTAALDQTRTATAARFALAQMAPGRAARILILTDGYSTEPLTGLAGTLVREGVPLDVRLFPRNDTVDAQVEDVRVPASVLPGEPFLIEGQVRAATDGPVPLAVLRDGTEVAKTTAQVSGGVARVRFSDRLGGGGGSRYELRVRKEGDTVAGNDTSAAWINVGHGRRVLLVTGYQGDPLAPVLAAQGFDVDVVTNTATLTLGRLSGARLVILNNVPSHKLPSSFLAGIDAFVRVQGGGLLMAGGRYSFGSGGYFQSAIDPLLPVSMELRQEHRKLSVAMAIVLDRSGSMAAPAGGGGALTKMDLANDGAARSLELLTDYDAAAVIAVDSSAHEILPLATLGANRAAAIDIVRRIQSEGGGIFIGEALRAAWQALHDAPQGQRHVVLFADAADSEEPDDYRRTIDIMVENGATISVIGMGTDKDQDAALLQEIAQRGKGRIFFTDEPSTLPALFAQETVTVARSAFLTDPVKAQSTSGWLQIARDAIGEAVELDAYNLSYLRPEATAAMVSQDEYAAPLLAFWHRGAGRTAAVAFPLGGEHSTRTRAWSRYGDLVQTLGRWLAAADTPPGVALRTMTNGHELTLRLLLDRDWDERVTRSPPVVQVVEGARGEPVAVSWERIAPGRFEARLSIQPGRIYRGAVGIGDATLAFGPVEGARGAEWTFDRRRIQELLAVAHQSGGGELTNLSSAWQRPAARRTPLDLRPAILLAFLALFLADALRTRLYGATVVRPTPAAPESVLVKTAPLAPAAPAPPAASEDTLAERLRRAKRR
jgi:uncharacterized membrane protein